MSRILFWSPNYAPELTGIAPLVTGAAEWLAAQGHDVEVVAPHPNYPERVIRPGYRGALWRTERRGDVLVHRSWLRVRPNERFLDKALYEGTYASASAPLVLRRLWWADALVCVVPSLAAAAYGAAAVRAARLLGKAPRYVVWVQDLVLSAATALEGVGRGAQKALGMARGLERFAAAAADRVVVCSPGFGRYLENIGADPLKITTVYNGVDTEKIRATPPPADRPVRLLYLGNLGYTQDFETLIEALQGLEPHVRLEICGEGNLSGRVRQLAESFPGVHVRPPVSLDELPELLASAHANVLTQKRGVAHANLPSKLGPYLASGRPVVAALDLDSPAADLLRASDGALVVGPEARNELHAALRRIVEDATLRAELGRASRAFAEEHLSIPATLGRLERAILE